MGYYSQFYNLLVPSTLTGSGGGKIRTALSSNVSVMLNPLPNSNLCKILTSTSFISINARCTSLHYCNPKLKGQAASILEEIHFNLLRPWFYLCPFSWILRPICFPYRQTNSFYYKSNCVLWQMLQSDCLCYCKGVE